MSKFNLSDFIVVTGNRNKLQEVNEILGTSHNLSTIDIPEIQSLNLDEVITAKAKAAFKIIKKPVLVSDVSLEIDALNGLPGTFVKYFEQTIGPARTALLIRNKNKKARATEALGLYDGKTLKIFRGVMEGTVSAKAKGKNGFGFDVVFIPRGQNRTYAQMTAEQKNKVSHRAKALFKLKAFLNKSR